MDDSQIYKLIGQTKDETKEAIDEVKRNVEKHETILDGKNGDAGLCEKQRETAGKLKTLSNRFEAYVPKIKKLFKTRERISWLGTIITALVSVFVSGVAFLYLALKFVKELKALGVIQ